VITTFFRGSWVGKWFEIRLNESIVLNSIFITMKKNKYIRNFGIRVPIMAKNNPDLMYYELWSYRTIIASTNDADDPVKKNIRIKHPIVVDR